MLTRGYKMRPALSRQRGLTLVELMIAVTLGMIVVGAGLTVLGTTLRSNAEAIRVTRLNQDLRSALTTITNDVARAGSWFLALRVVDTTTGSDLRANALTGGVTLTAYDRGTNNFSLTAFQPFSTANLGGRTLVWLAPNPLVAGSPLTRYDLTINTRPNNRTLTVTVPGGVTLPSTFVQAGSWSILNPFDVITLSPAGDCILLSYDLDNDGLRDNEENFGFRRNAATGTLQGTTTPAVCDNDAGWGNVTDPAAINITNLTITDANQNVTRVASNQLQVTTRAYTVQLTGQLRNDPTVTRTLQETVKVRSTRVF